MGKRMRWKIFRCRPNAKMPTQNRGDAGFDLYYAGETLTLEPGYSYTFPLGIKCTFPEDYVALLWDRSSLGVCDIHRTAGVIDSSYRGEWKVHLTNVGRIPWMVHHNDKIVQVIFQKLPQIDYGEVFSEACLGLTQRGENGFGSTNQK